MLFHQKDVWIVSKALIGFVGNGAIRDWRNYFQISKPLETIIRPLRVMFQNHPDFNTICTSETVLRKLHFSFILLLHKKQVPKISIASLQRWLHLIPQTATGTCFRTSAPTISYFVKFGFISTRFSTDFVSFKKTSYHLLTQYKGSSAQIFVYILFWDVF